MVFLLLPKEAKTLLKMKKNNKKQIASKNSKGSATKNSLVDLLPEQVQIHIASYDAHNGVLLTAPGEFASINHYIGQRFSNGAEIPDGTPLSITIDYPLTNPLTFEIPFISTLNGMLEIICEKYKEIYREEEETSTIKVGEIGQTPSGVYLMNRCTTNGKYGIWGHDISDLYLEKLELDTAKKELILYVGS